MRQMTDILLDEVPYIPGTQGIGYHLQYRCVKDYTQPRAWAEQLPLRPRMARPGSALPLAPVSI